MDRVLQIGVIGAGGIARRKTMPAIGQARNCRVAAVMDPVGAEAIAAEFGVPGYTREADLLADPAVEAVYIASPVAHHLAQIELAAQAGKHVLCEKPLTLTSADARCALDTCRRQGVMLQEGYMMKFHGAHRKIRELVEAGRLGRIVSMRAQLSCWYPPIAGAWRQDPATGGGGSLIDMGTHLLDLLEFFAGPVRSVAAAVSNLVQDYRSEDAATLLLEFASGAHGTIDTFFCIPDEASRTRLEVYGSQGAILAEGTIGQGSGGRMEGIFGLGAGGYDAAQNKDQAPTFQPVAFESINPYTAQCETFADCVLQGRQPEVNTGEAAVHLLELVEQAYAFARERHR